MRTSPVLPQSPSLMHKNMERGKEALPSLTLAWMAPLSPRLWTALAGTYTLEERPVRMCRIGRTRGDVKRGRFWMITGEMRAYAERVTVEAKEWRRINLAIYSYRASGARG